MCKNQTDCHSKLLGLTNNKVKRKYGIVSISSWTFVNNSSFPIEWNRFSKWQAYTYHRKVWVPPTPPRSPAFIDTLCSCLRDGTQLSYLSPFFFFLNQMQFFFFFFFLCVFFFFQTKFTVSGAYIWHWCKTHSDWHAWSFSSKVCTCHVCNEDGKKAVFWKRYQLETKWYFDHSVWTWINFVGPRFYLFIFSVLLKVFFSPVFCSWVIISWYIYRNYGVYRFAVGKPFWRI